MTLRWIRNAAVALGLTACFTPAQAASVERGHRIVERNCALCHAVGLRDTSRRPEAPPFRDLHNRYPVETLAEGLAEGMLTGHPQMPEFRFSESEINDIIAYLNSVQAGKISLPVAKPAPRGQHLPL